MGVWEKERVCVRECVSKDRRQKAVAEGKGAAPSPSGRGLGRGRNAGQRTTSVDDLLMVDYRFSCGSSGISGIRGENRKKMWHWVWGHVTDIMIGPVF